MALPLANDRIEKAVAIVLSGATLHADGYAVGASQSRPPMSYSVNGTCGCPDVCYAGLLAKAHKVDVAPTTEDAKGACDGC